MAVLHPSTLLTLERRVNVETYRFPMSSSVTDWKTFLVIRQINHAFHRAPSICLDLSRSVRALANLPSRRILLLLQVFFVPFPLLATLSEPLCFPEPPSPAPVTTPQSGTDGGTLSGALGSLGIVCDRRLTHRRIENRGQLSPKKSEFTSVFHDTRQTAGVGKLLGRGTREPPLVA